MWFFTLLHYESRTHFVDSSTTYRSDLDEEDIPSYEARCQTLHFGTDWKRSLPLIVHP
jgi:hypothetical protein